MKEPDFKQLRDIASRIESLKAANGWTREAFEQALAEGRAAAGDTPSLVEFVINEAQPEWLAEAQIAKDAGFEAQHPRDPKGEFTLKYPGAKSRRQDPDDYHFISTGAKENFYTLRHRFTEPTYANSEHGPVSTGAREYDYHLQNLSIDKEQAIKQAEALTGLKLSADFDVLPIGQSVESNRDYSIMQAGKYEGQSIHEVRQHDPNYLIWLSENMQNSDKYRGNVEMIRSLMAHELKARSDEKALAAAKESSDRAEKAEKYKPFVKNLIGGSQYTPDGTSDWPYKEWEDLGEQNGAHGYRVHNPAFTDSIVVRKVTHNGLWAVDGGGFVWSVAAGLMNGEAPRGRGLDIMLDIMAKGAGRRNSKGYAAKMNELQQVFGSE